MKRDAEELVLWAARSSHLKKIPTPTIMHYTWIEANRKRDKDNISSFGRKVIQDALVHGGYLSGDGWSQIEGFTDAFQIGESMIIVEFEEVK